MSFLTLRGISKRYGAVVALDDVTLSVVAGSRTAIVGPSGSGKTTLLRIVAGFEMPDAGEVILGASVLADASGAVPAHLRGVGLVMQDGALFPHLSIGENIGFGLAREVADRAGRIAGLLRLVELDEAMLGRRPDELSGGQQQRVALARALAREPRLMLLDEPFSALDTGLRASTRATVARLLGAAGIAAVLVTHDQAEALSFADQVAVMGNGRLLQVGAPQDVYWRPTTRAVAAFLGDAIFLPAEVGDGVAACALGRVEVADVRRRGKAEIMLRPEQVALSDVAGEVRAEVVDVDFAGAVSTVGLRLGEDGFRLSLRQPGLEVPPVGTMVSISVGGVAHLL